MQELINKLTEKAGLSHDQASKAIETIKEFVKEKFPMMAGAVDNLLGESTPAPAATPAAAEAKTGSSNFLDEISDFIPGEAGQKVEDFAKGAADKISGMFGGNK